MKTLILALSIAFSSPAMAQTLSKIFKNKKPIIGAIYLPPLPGEKGFESMEKATETALGQMAILEEEGVDGILFETGKGIGAKSETIAAAAVIVAAAVRAAKTIVVGIEILWHDPIASLAVAKVSNARFIRTDFFADKMWADKTLIDEKPKRITDYRTFISGEGILIFTDVQVKYGIMVDKKKTITESVQDAFKGKSDGVIVSGAKSGVPPDIAKVKEVKGAAGANDVILGSGTNVDNVTELLTIADAAIVGTSISEKTGGPLVRSKVRAYMDAVLKLR